LSNDNSSDVIPPEFRLGLIDTPIMHPRNSRSIYLITALWLITIAVAGFGRFFNYFPAAFLGVSLVLTTVALIFAHFTSSQFQDFTNNLSLKKITLIHSVRILLALTFFIFRDEIPVLFFNRAAYGDLFSGTLALTVLLLHRHKWYYVLFNVIGTLDIINALRSAMALSIAGDEQIRVLSHPLLIFIVLFFVPTLLFAHYLAFKRILRNELI